MRIVDILNDGVRILESGNIVNSFYEARLLLEYVIHKSKEWIMVHIDDEISDENIKIFNELIKRRISGEPLQYIIGMCCFMGNDFLVNNSVLIPRADTEVWVEKAIDIARGTKMKAVLDLCTGSGCIGISIKKLLKNIDVYAVDISENALEVARKNAEHNSTPINFIQSDLFSNVSEIEFDMIVSNPPYIPSNDIKELDREVLNEPIIALDGGNDGLDFYRKIVSEASMFLKDNGYLVFEFGYNQVDDVADILKQNNFYIEELVKDYSGNNRAVISRKGVKYE